MLIVFVCEHGAAKSLLAATYFNKLARELGLDLHAISRGTNPDPEFSLQTIRSLAEEGLVPMESAPQKFSDTDLKSAQRVVSFCELPLEYQQSAKIEYWKDVPPVSESYEQARDVIVERIHQLLSA